MLLIISRKEGKTMKRLKKLLALAVCFALSACVLGGCALKDKGPSAASSSAASSQTVSQEPDRPYTIGLLQYGENPSLDTVREAFMSRLEEWNYDEDKVRIDYQNAGGDAAKAEEICKKFVQDKADLIVALSPPAAKAAAEAAQNTETKVLFAGVGDPEKELGIKGPSPSGNVTGVQGSSSPAAVIDLALQINPELKTVGLLYYGEDSLSQAAAAEAKAYCEGKGLQVKESAIPKDGGAPEAAASLCKEADAVYSPADSLVAGSAPTVAETLRKAKKPWYVGDSSMVQGGALASVTVDYTEIGHQAADMAVELMAGKPAAQIPVSSLEAKRVSVNQTALDALQAKIPAEVLETADFFADAAPAQ